MPACHSYNEKQLLLQVAEGNENAFAQLFYLHHHKLGVYIYRLTDSFQLSQDVVQEVFIKIWTNRDKLKDVETFEAYFYSMARHHAFAVLKKISREHDQNMEWVKLVVRNPELSSEPAAINEAYLQLIEEAINRLPSQQRKIYHLSRVDRLKYEEIALQLNISFETVKKHMHLALRSIRQYVLFHKDVVLLLSIVVSSI